MKTIGAKHDSLSFLKFCKMDKTMMLGLLLFCIAFLAIKEANGIAVSCGDFSSRPVI